MSESRKLIMSFNNNDEVIDAYMLYQKAFNAKKIPERTFTNSGEIYVMIDTGDEILLKPSGDVGVEYIDLRDVVHEVQFNNKNDFYSAYDAIREEAQDYSLECFDSRVSRSVFITDKFGFRWKLSITVE